MQIKDYWRELETDATAIDALTESGCGRELKVLTSAFDWYSEALSRIPPAENGKATIARLAILSQILNAFHVMISSAMRGFYIESLVPLRHVYENWLAFWYLAKFLEEAHRWLDPTWEMRPPKAETMLKKIDHPSKQSQSRLRDFYSEMNRFAHTDPVVVLSRLDQEGDKTLIGVGIRFDGDDFRACSYGLSLWIGNCLHAVSSVVPDTDEWQAQHEALRRDILELIDEYNIKHAPGSSHSNDQDPNAD